MQRQAAFYFKDKGNEHFKAGDFQKAIGVYNKSLLYIRAILPTDNSEVSSFQQMSSTMQEKLVKDEGQKSELKDLHATCLLNQAQCFFKMQKFEKCIEKATLSFELKPQVKTLFRRAKGYEGLKNFEKAIEDYYACMKLDPSDQNDIQKELHKAKATMKKADAQNEKRL